MRTQSRGGLWARLAKPEFSVVSTSTGRQMHGTPGLVAHLDLLGGNVGMVRLISDSR